MFTNFKRILSFAIKDFGRNKGISVASIFVLTVTVMILTSLFFFHGLTSYLTSEIQNKIDITAYFKDGTSEKDILSVKDKILKISPDIKSVQYVSKDQALAFFNDAHRNDKVLAQALQQVGQNPFLPSLNVTTNGDPLMYEQVSNTLQTSDFSNLIESVDFSQKKNIIEKVYSITSNVNTFGLIAGIVLILIAMLVVYNTIRLAIENSKEEIGTMKIVGAGNWFVRGPFVVQGMIYGLIAFLICILISGLTIYFLSPKLEIILPGFNMLSYLLANWWIFLLIQLGFGVGMGAISAVIVVKKYLDV